MALQSHAALGLLVGACALAPAAADEEEPRGSLGVGLLWFVVIGFMFFAQHHVCDAYFVPAINVFVTRMRKSKSSFMQRWGEEAVAGATICALGCNGPELFTNLISLFTGSDAGIGVVVGSEIFNLLIIVGAATVCAPVLPLQLERVPFARDCFFYGLSIALLYWSLLDKKIEWYEALVLLSAAAVYVMSVYFTTDVVNAIPALRPAEADSLDVEGKKKGKMHGVEVEVEEILHGRMADSHNAGVSGVWNFDPIEAGMYAEPMDTVGSKAALKTKNTARGSIGFQFHGPDSMLGGSMLRYKDLSEVVQLEMGVIELQFINGLKHVTLRLTVQDDDKRDQLLKNIETYSLGRPYIHKYDSTVKGAIDHFKHTLGSKDVKLSEKLFAFPEFVIDFVLKGTLFAVDVKDARKQDRWMACFGGAMFWLAIFSFLMLEVAEQINYNIPELPNAFLGITVCAIGTSFPNAVASILMSQQNKPAAAIANALGSNVQNVFLAMALPWMIYSCQTNFEPIAQNVEGITEGVFWMAGTLALVILFVLVPPVCSIVKMYGWILMVVYVCYLVLTSGETFGWWPPLMA